MRLAWYWGREDGNHRKGRGKDVVGGYEGCGDYELWGHTRSQAQFAVARVADDPPPLTHSESRHHCEVVGVWRRGDVQKSKPNIEILNSAIPDNGNSGLASVCRGAAGTS